MLVHVDGDGLQYGVKGMIELEPMAGFSLH